MDFDKMMKESSNYIADNQITGVWSFLTSIDWSERWLQCLLLTHALLLLFSVVCRRLFAAQATVFMGLLAVVYWAETINQWGAKHWQRFSRQQYFDSSGMFISLVVSLPLLTICLVIMIQWVYNSSSLLITLKQRQLLGKGGGALDSSKQKKTQ